MAPGGWQPVTSLFLCCCVLLSSVILLQLMSIHFVRGLLVTLSGYGVVIFTYATAGLLLATSNKPWKTQLVCGGVGHGRKKVKKTNLDDVSPIEWKSHPHWSSTRSTWPKNSVLIGQFSAAKDENANKALPPSHSLVSVASSKLMWPWKPQTDLSESSL